MLKRNQDSKYEIDCRTVNAVRIAGEWVYVREFTIGRPVFGIPDSDFVTGVVYSYGDGLHPLSYFITDTDGHMHMGPLHHIQQLTYKPEEPAD